LILSDLKNTGDRLADVGILAAGLAHELNNPIGSILLAARNAKDSPDRVDECLDTIHRNARRCAEVVRSVLQVARSVPGDRVPTDLNGLVRRAVGQSAESSARAHAEIVLELAAKIAAPTVNAVEIEHALVNLLRNAAEAGSGHRIGVATRDDDEFVHIVISDNGRGMTADVAARAFDPFFTTRQDDGGTGLGLSLVRAIAHGHGGRVDLQSAPTEGTILTVSLPIGSLPIGGQPKGPAGNKERKTDGGIR
jgi:two-component system NtrC family sensor kinase